MFIEERHREILNILLRDGSISIGDILQKFEISPESARRDLRLLEEKGMLKRTHGGAIPVRQVAFSAPKDSTVRDITEIKENYMAIALKAVSMIEDNDVVFITSATVGYFMAQNMPKDKHIRVVTNSIIIAEEIRAKENISIMLLGGEMDHKGVCYDAFAVDMIRRLRFDKSFITSASISPKFGLSMQKSQAINFWNAVIDSSRVTIGLYPTEKIGFESILSICPAGRLQILITDWDANEEDLKAFSDMGIDIILADR